LQPFFLQDFIAIMCALQVVHDRRSANDRRKLPASLEDLLILFSQLPSEDPGQKQ